MFWLSQRSASVRQPTGTGCQQLEPAFEKSWIICWLIVLQQCRLKWGGSNLPPRVTRLLQRSGKESTRPHVIPLPVATLGREYLDQKGKATVSKLSLTFRGVHVVRIR